MVSDLNGDDEDEIVVLTTSEIYIFARNLRLVKNISLEDIVDRLVNEYDVLIDMDGDDKKEILLILYDYREDSACAYLIDFNEAWNVSIMALGEVGLRDDFYQVAVAYVKDADNDNIEEGVILVYSEMHVDEKSGQFVKTRTERVIIINNMGNITFSSITSVRGYDLRQVIVGSTSIDVIVVADNKSGYVYDWYSGFFRPVLKIDKPDISEILLTRTGLIIGYESGLLEFYNESLALTTTIRFQEKILHVEDLHNKSILVITKLNNSHTVLNVIWNYTVLYSKILPYFIFYLEKIDSGEYIAYTDQGLIHIKLEGKIISGEDELEYFPWFPYKEEFNVGFQHSFKAVWFGNIVATVILMPAAVMLLILIITLAKLIKVEKVANGFNWKKILSTI